MPGMIALVSAHTVTCPCGATSLSTCFTLQPLSAIPVAAAHADCRCITGDDDNDGLWTCVYAAGLAFKYAVTRHEEDRQRAWHR